MQWINAISTRPSLEAAVTEVVEEVQKSHIGNPDVGFVFISSAYASDYPRLVPLLLDKLSLPVLIGCSGGGIIGMASSVSAVEIEDSPALSLTVACLPGVKIQPFYLESDSFPDLDSSPTHWTNLIGVSPEDNPDFILLADPFSSGINDLIEGLDFAYPDGKKIGGLASGSMVEAQSTLFYHDGGKSGVRHRQRQGTVGLALSGNITVETIVAQGCRPIGRPYVIAEGERNVILGLQDVDTGVNKPPLELLRALMETLEEKDRDLAQNSLFIGIARDEFKQALGQGDFLIRNILGVDPRHGAIAVGDKIRPGQRIQFHLRDAATSALDLRLLLESYQRQPLKLQQVRGALMFSCLGRGQSLYEEKNFDTGIFHDYLGGIPLGGFFCNGEIGPVGGRTFLHGYTSALAIFKPGSAV